MGHPRRHRFALACAAVCLIGCTAVLGIDEDYYLVGQGGATSTTNGTIASVGGGAGKPRGEPCQAATECQSQQCTDGVCCEEACDGACSTCNQAQGATQNGICTLHAPLTDPDMECGADQICDGMGACVMCGVRPEPPAMACPPECTGGCVPTGECHIDCGTTSCQGQALVCPVGFKCRVSCTQLDSCRDAIIDCPDTYECRVQCAGGRACDGVNVNCGSGVCELACESGTQVCSDAQLTCGAEACVATCGTASSPSVTCDQACVCVTCQ